MELLTELIKEYQRLLEKREEFNQWAAKHPEIPAYDLNWKYRGEIITNERLKRTGLIIRQTMIDTEKKFI